LLWKIYNKTVSKYDCENNKLNTRYFWVCDFSNTTGEGNLARLYISKIIGRKKIISSKLLIKNKLIIRILNHKYISPFFGVFISWYFYLKNKNISYINYLPMWNFFIFLLLPPKTQIGPISGGAYFGKNYQYIIRKYLFPILYKISEKILNYRYKRIVFATSLLKQYLSNQTIKNSEFNFIFKYLKKKKKIKKNIDFLIYYRDHKNKLSLFNYSFIKKINKKKLKIYIIGDKLDLPNIQNIGYISNSKLNKLLARTKYTLSSNENILSLFNIECINNYVKIFAEKTHIPKEGFLKKNFIPLSK